MPFHSLFAQSALIEHHEERSKMHGELLVSLSYNSLKGLDRHYISFLLNLDPSKILISVNIFINTCIDIRLVSCGCSPF